MTKEKIKNEIFGMAKYQIFLLRLSLEVFFVIIPASVLLFFLLFSSEVVSDLQLPFFLNFSPYFLALIVFIVLAIKDKTITKIPEKRIQERAAKIFEKRKEDVVRDLKGILADKSFSPFNSIGFKEEKLSQLLGIYFQIENEFSYYKKTQ